MDWVNDACAEIAAGRQVQVRPLGGGDGGPLLAFWDQQIQHFVYDVAVEQLIAVGLGGFQVWAFKPGPKKDEKY